MRVTQIEFEPENSSLKNSLSFRDPTRSNRYNVKAIGGLDADELIPRYYGATFSEFGNLEQSASKFHDISLRKRELVFRIELNPRFGANETYSDLRDTLYKLISSVRTGIMKIKFVNETGVVAVISGFITKFEAPLNEKNSEVQLTIDCSNDPMLRAPEPINVPVSGLDPARFVIDDDLSTAPHGFIFEIEFLQNVISFIVTDPDNPTWSFLAVSLGLNTGWKFQFSSESGNKYFRLIKLDESVVNWTDLLYPGSAWPMIFPGINTLRFAASDAGSVTSSTFLQINSISYTPTYWGV